MTDPATDDLEAWLDTPEPGWTWVAPPPSMAIQSFVSGDANDGRLRVRYFRPGSEAGLNAKVWFGPAAQGPPGHAHGGSMAAVLDEVMGGAAWAAGHACVAAQLTTHFRAMLPLESRCVVEARVASVEGRKVRVEATLGDGDGLVYAEGTALFIEIDPERFGDLASKAAALLGGSTGPEPAP